VSAVVVGRIGAGRVVGRIGEPAFALAADRAADADRPGRAPLMAIASPLVDRVAVAIGRGLARALVPRRPVPAARPEGAPRAVRATPLPSPARTRARLHLVRGGPGGD
jgi:hypothetical protein